jgi:hypothetical protein
MKWSLQVISPKGLLSWAFKISFACQLLDVTRPEMAYLYGCPKQEKKSRKFGTLF